MSLLDTLVASLTSLVTASIAGVAAAGGLGPSTTGFDVRTPASVNGSAPVRAHGTVTFLSRTSVEVSSTVGHVCSARTAAGAKRPSNGYVWFQIRYADGSFDGGRGLNVNWALDGCSTSNTRVQRFTPGKPISWIRVRVDQSSSPTGPSQATVYSPRKSNPHS